MKICSVCNKRFQIKIFVKCSRRKDGYSTRCKPCHRKISLKSVKMNPDSRKKSYDNYYKRNKTQHILRCIKWSKNHPDNVREIKRTFFKNHYKSNFQIYKSWRKLTYAVKSGKIPRIGTLKCIKCGGDAKHYHHYLGYEDIHALDVIPVCVLCHRKEHKSFPRYQNILPMAI